jgi:hypothetical protein
MLRTLVFPALTFSDMLMKTESRLEDYIARCYVVRHKNSHHTVNDSLPTQALYNVARIQHLNDALVLRMSGVVPPPRHTRIKGLWCYCHLQGRQCRRRIRSVRSRSLSWHALACRTAGVKWRRRRRRCSQACVRVP